MSTLKRVSEQSWHRRAFDLLFTAGGIIIFYTIFSYLQEIITKQKYGATGERFTYMQSLVFVQCFVNTIVAYFFKSKNKANDNVPVQMYSMCSISYVLAMLFSNLALEYLNYPTQVLGKSCKPIPILISGVLFAHKSYPWRKYLYILMIVIGMATFLYKEKPGKAHGGFSLGTGEFLLFLSLLMDGVTGAVQDRIRHYYHTEKWSMMFFMNFVSTLFIGGSVVLTGEFYKFFAFVYDYPYVLNQMMMFSIAGAVGQCFIFNTVTNFGPLTCSIVTTLRKLFSVVFSIMLFNHSYTSKDAIGAGIVFTALFLDAVDSKRSYKQTESSEKPKSKA
ncbi:Solute carrier family 35 member B1 [Aphelenchoides bicaudatus]|nr:Solute carrier family 35 member B1 [Aphelenchoides bicaudatus]